MIVGRIIGWIVFVAALPVLATDVLLWTETGYWLPLQLGQLWYKLDQSSLSLVQALVVRYLDPYGWDPVMITVLACWAFVGADGAGDPDYVLLPRAYPTTSGRGLEGPESALTSRYSGDRRMRRIAPTPLQPVAMCL